MEHPIDFVDLIELFWAGRLKIAIAVIIMCALAVTADLVLAPRYKASELLEVRVSHQRLSGFSGLARSLGGLAGLAAGSLGGSGDERQVALATLKSRYIIEHFISGHNLLPVLFASKWDERKNRWATSNADDIPTDQDGYRLFRKKVFSVADDGTTGLVRVVVQWRNPQEAAAWLRDIVNETNVRLQKREVARFEADIRYLSTTAQSVMVVPVKESLYSLMALEYRKLMVAENPEDAPLQVVDPVVVPRRPESRLLMLLVLGVGGGIVLGLLYVVVEGAIKERRKGVGRAKVTEPVTVKEPRG